MLSIIKNLTGSLFLATLLLLATPLLTWILWEFSKKKTSFFNEFSWEKLEVRLGRIRKDPYNYLFQPFSHYFILFLCSVYYFFHRIPPLGSSVIFLSVFFTVVESEVSPIARTIFSLYVFHILYLLITLRYTEVQREAVYKRFGKPHIDKVVGNAPVSPSELSIGLITTGVAGGLGLLGAYVHSKQEGDALIKAAEERANASKYVADKQAQASLLLADKQARSNMLTVICKTASDIFNSDAPMSVKREALDMVKEAIKQANPPLNYGFAANAVVYLPDPVEGGKEIEKEDENEKKDDEK